MEENNIPLLIHGEDTDKNIDIFDREKTLLTNIFSKLFENF